MPKREMPIDADSNINFSIIMDDLLRGSELKEPKDGRYDASLGPTKWRFFQEKSEGVMDGFFAKKVAD